MELIGIVLAFVLVVGMIALTARGMFAREATHALKRVRQREEELQAKADVLEQRLAQMERDHRQKLTHAQAEADRLMQEAKQQAMNIRTAAVEEAKHRARQLMGEAEHARQQMIADLARELHSKAVAWTCTAFQQLLTTAEQDTLHARLLQQLVHACEQMDIAPLNGTGERIRLTSAKPIGQEARQAIQHCFSTKLHRTMTLEETIDDTLLAGGVVALGDLLIDGSLKQYFTRMAHTA